MERFVAHVVNHEPVEATRFGLTERDTDLPDLTTTALAARARSLSDLGVAIALELAALGAAPTGAEREARADLQLLRDTVEWRRIEVEDRPRAALDPLYALDTVTVGVRELLLDERTGVADRRRRVVAAIERTRMVPTMLEQAGALLAGVSAPAYDVTVQRVQGLLALVREQLPRHAAELDLDVARARTAGEDAAESIEAFAALVDELVDQRRLDWRVGPVHHERALRLAVGTDMDASEIEDRARTVLAETRAEMVELAAGGWERRFPGERRPSGEDELLRRVLGAIADTSLPPELLLAETGRALEESRSFLARWGAVDEPPSDGLRLAPLPMELQGVAVAFITRPPPLRPEVGSVYNMSAVPRSWDEARQRSFLREYHPAMLRSLAVHEGYPGHYVQLAHASRHPRLARRALSRSAFAEGWAVLMERLTLEAGFGTEGSSAVPYDDLLLTQRKMALRCAANALLDIGLHAAAMTDDDAVTLLTVTTLQEEAEALGKLQRAKVTSGQLSSYFAGSEELEALLRLEQGRAGSGFALGPFLRRVLSHGTPTVAMVAEALSDTAAATGPEAERRPFAPGQAVGQGR
jgi:hypothetical protein